MADRPHIRDLDVLRDVETIGAIAHEQRLAILGLLTRDRLTVAMLAEHLGVPANRVHYHLRRLVDLDLVKEIDEGRRHRATERYYTAAARHFIVDPGIGLRDPGMIAAIDSSLESMLLEWRRGALLKIDVAAIARRIVRDCARVRQGETVLVMYGRFGIELGEACLVEVEAAGARPIVKPWSANWVLRMLDRFSAEELAERAFLPRDIDESLDAIVFISTSVPEGPSPTQEHRAKLPGLLETVSRWYRDLHRRGIRHVEFGVPFRSEFEHGRTSPEDGATIFWKAVMADLDAVGQLGGRLHERLCADPSITLRGSRGAEVGMTIDVGSISVSDGVISAVDIAARRSFEPLPAGSLVAIPIAASVNGTFVADYTFWGGVHVASPRLTLREGRIVGIDAEDREGAQYLRDVLKGASGDGDRLASVSFGLNAAGHGPTGKTMLDSCLEGTVTLQFGNNELLGGDVRATLSLAFPSATLTATSARHDIVRDGAFVWERGTNGPRRGRLYARSGLGPAGVERIARELVLHLESERAYRDPGLKHGDVAAALSVSPSHLSQALHQGLGTSFNDLIARYRIEEFKRRVADPAYAGQTDVAIALGAGFASKASFYRIFRRETGMTPAAYRALQKQRGDGATSRSG
jgi:AraC-like DNA-binding protein/leucyl aminopeptidase (aminopeptidase T)